MDGGSRPAAGTRPLTSETIETLRNRVSVRSFTAEPLGEAVVQAILESAFRAPTSSNIQSYSVVVVRDAETKRQLSEVTRHQQHVIEAPVFLAFCADLTRIHHAITAAGHDFSQTNLEFGLVSSIDAALVGMSAYLAAESLGVKGVMIGAIRNDAAATARILGLPPRVYAVFGLCLGYPADVPKQKPRMPYAAMVHYERYGDLRGCPSMEAAVAGYDVALGEHYTATRGAQSADTWSSDTAKKFHVQPREDLRAKLAAMGFNFR